MTDDLQQNNDNIDLTAISKRLDDIERSANIAGCRITEISYHFQDCIAGLLNAFTKYQQILHKSEDAMGQIRTIYCVISRTKKSLNITEPDSDKYSAMCECNTEPSE